jgi:hypothetical protein
MYPGAQGDRKWTIADMDKLIGEQLRMGIYDAQELSGYYRAFYQITQYLRTSRQQLSEAEQSRAFVRGFQPDFWSKIETRLEVKYPDHFPGDPYPLMGILEAAEWVLHKTTPATFTLRSSSIIPNHPNTSHAIPTSPTTVKTEDLSAMFDKFTSTLLKTLAASHQQPSQAQRTYTPRANTSNAANMCIFCGHPDHFISECLVREQYLADKKCKKDSEGKIVLPDGKWPTKAIPGRWIKERVDEWHRRNPTSGSQTTSQMLYGISPSPVSTPGPSHTGLTSRIIPAEPSQEDRIDELERELFVLRSGRKHSPGIVHRSDKTPEPSQNAQPQQSSGSSGAPPNSSQPANPQIATEEPIHPFANIRETAYRPPHEKNYASKSKESPAYHTLAPIVSPAIAGEVYRRSMKNPCVTLTTEELLSISPEVRTKLREAVTPKRNPNPPQVVANTLVEHGEHTIVAPEYCESYSNAINPGENRERVKIAKESISLRSIPLNMKGQGTIEAVVDPGCQIIAVSEDVCHAFGLSYDPSIRLNMESANGEIDQSLGLCRNVPCRIGDITLYLQIHVIRTPAYDMLIGRPFDVLTTSVITNFANEDQTITIKDPNSKTIMTIPTLPRKPPQYTNSRRIDSGFQRSMK